MSITDQHNITFTSDYDMNSILIKFYIIGDLKALFQVLGRDGYDSLYCLYCKCKSKSWEKQYKSSSACINAEKWTVEKIQQVALDQFQKQSSGINFTSVGVRQYPLISCIPLIRALPPILHLLLGLGNDIYTNFKKFIH